MRDGEEALVRELGEQRRVPLLFRSAREHEIVARAQLSVTGLSEQTQQQVDAGHCGGEARVAEQASGGSVEVLLLGDFVRITVSKRGRR